MSPRKNAQDFLKHNSTSMFPNDISQDFVIQNINCSAAPSSNLTALSSRSPNKSVIVRAGSSTVSFIYLFFFTITIEWELDTDAILICIVYH